MDHFSQGSVADVTPQPLGILLEEVEHEAEDQQLMLSLPSKNPYKATRPFANYPTTYRMEEQLGPDSGRTLGETSRSRSSQRKKGKASLEKTRPW